jgi:hypothetical protein
LNWQTVSLSEVLRDRSTVRDGRLGFGGWGVGRRQQMQTQNEPVFPFVYAPETTTLAPCPRYLLLATLELGTTAAAPMSHSKPLPSVYTNGDVPFGCEFAVVSMVVPLHPRLQLLGSPKGAPCKAPGSPRSPDIRRPGLSPPLLCFPGSAPTARAYLQ